MSDVTENSGRPVNGRASQWGRKLGSIVTGLALVLAALMLLPPLVGLHRYVLVGGSMEPTIHRGAVIFDRVVPVSSLRVGDVITYTPPPRAQGPVAHAVTHRIIWIGRDRFGARAFRTKGDANRVADPWRFTLHSATQAREVFSIPYVGYAIAALSLRPVRMALIGLPALLIALGIIVSLWQDAGEEVRRRREPPRPDPPSPAAAAS
jgi:signal peptidase I